MRNESSNNMIEGSRKIGDENLLICQRRNRSREKKKFKSIMDESNLRGTT